MPNEIPNAASVAAPLSAAKPAFDPKRSQGGAPRTFEKNQRRNPRKGGGRDARPKSEFDQKIISIRRVTRVASGGRRFSFSVAMVVGNRKGSVGVGIGKGGDTSIAIDKSLRDAKKNLIKLSLTKSMSIPHEVRAKYSASQVIIMPAPGKGMGAGSSVRNVIELAGITDVTAKLLSRSKNALNNAQVAIKALSAFRKKNDIPAMSTIAAPVKK